MYIAFPIGWMYYFGTNLDTRFQVPDFWPKAEETHKIPFEKDEQVEMKNRLREVRLERRRRRLERGGVLDDGHVAHDGEEIAVAAAGRSEVGDRGFGRGAIERWARGQ